MLQDDANEICDAEEEGGINVGRENNEDHMQLVNFRKLSGHIEDNFKPLRLPPEPQFASAQSLIGLNLSWLHSIQLGRRIPTVVGVSRKYSGEHLKPIRDERSKLRHNVNPDLPAEASLQRVDVAIRAVMNVKAAASEKATGCMMTGVNDGQRSCREHGMYYVESAKKLKSLQVGKGNHEHIRGQADIVPILAHQIRTFAKQIECSDTIETSFKTMLFQDRISSEDEAGQLRPFQRKQKGASPQIEGYIHETRDL
ncbi:hypothetical protein K438DRAFT_2080053 [Mycena galopus ATCC 62051]|nr:hypothetical protein K438DRAFT_2080053 [Mycena galopus ATCC 62051]